MPLEIPSREMSIQACIAGLQGLGMGLWVEGGQLRFLGVQELVDSSLFKILKARKDEALAVLAERPILARRAALVEREGITAAPLTELQRRWHECRRLGGPVDNHIRLLRLKGQLNRAALEASLKQLQDRHSILRMRIGVGPDNRSQEIVANPPALRLDEASCPADQIEERVEAFGEVLCEPAEGETLRLLLLRVEEGGFALALCASRLALNWSALNILQSDLIRIYALLDAGAPPPPVIKSLRFLDYPLWQAERRNEGPASPSEWPLLRTLDRRAVAPRRKPRMKLSLDLPEAATLAMLNRFRGQASSSTVMMTIWSLALAKLRGEEKVASTANVVDVPAIMQSVAGCFAGLAPLVADLTGRPSLDEAVMRVASVQGNGSDVFSVAPVEPMVRSGAAADRIVVLSGRPPQDNSLDTNRMFRSQDFDASTMVEDLAAYCFLGERPQMLIHHAGDLYSPKAIEDFQRAIVETIETAASAHRRSLVQ